MMNNGGGPLLRVITTAPNVRPGMLTVLATEGCVVNGVEITKRKMKGVESVGMLCSAMDCGWTSVADGQAVELTSDMDVDIGDPITEEPPEGYELPGEEETEEEEEAAAPEPQPVEEDKGDKKKKKKKKGGADLEAMLMAEAGLEEAPKEVKF